MHTKNDSFPLKNILEVGGMDENYDRGRGPGDHDVGRRLLLSGLQGWLAKDAGVIVLNPRAIMPNPNLAIKEHDTYAGRWDHWHGQNYYYQQEALGTRVAPNPIPLDQLRDDLWSWREMSQEMAAVIPKNVVSDAEYFK